MADWENKGLFKAYSPTKKGLKEPQLSYTKPENHFSLQEMQSKNGFIGILAPDAIMLDADDEQNSKALQSLIQGENLGCMITQREGGRGIHAYFINANDAVVQNHTKVMLACGIVVDIKIGSRNGYDCLKFDGVERFIVYDVAPYQNIPKYLLPLKGSNIDFKSMDEGDGRNQALFNYILTLQSFDFTNEEIRETIGILNKYVLKKPLSEKELNVILRDDAFKKQSFFKGTKFLHDKFAEYLKRDSHIIKLNGQLHIYQDGVYCADYTKIERAMIKEIPFLKKSQRNEIMQYLNLICEQKQINRSNLIAFKNGIYNLNDDSFTDFCPEIVITNMIPWAYNPAATSELVDLTLDKLACHDGNIRALLEEALGSCLYRSNTLGGGKAFILTGEGENGKSTFLDMIKTMLGIENISSLDLKELSERFKNAELSGKLANIGDDISSEYIPNASVFKKLVTGERIQAERKGQDPFEFNNYSKFLFSANDIPRLGGAKESYAIIRRLVIIPFEAKFSKDDADYNPNIKYDLREQEAVEYSILLALQGLKRVLQNKRYTESKKVQKELDDFEISNNNIKAFVKECEENDFENNFSILNEPTQDVYRHYEEFCFRNGVKAFSKIEFGRQLCKLLCLESVVSGRRIKGNHYRIYRKMVADSTS